VKHHDSDITENEITADNVAANTDFDSDGHPSAETGVADAGADEHEVTVVGSGPEQSGVNNASHGDSSESDNRVAGHGESGDGEAEHRESEHSETEHREAVQAEAEQSGTGQSEVEGGDSEIIAPEYADPEYGDAEYGDAGNAVTEIGTSEQGSPEQGAPEHSASEQSGTEHGSDPLTSGADAPVETPADATVDSPAAPSAQPSTEHPSTEQPAVSASEAEREHEPEAAHTEPAAAAPLGSTFDDSTPLARELAEITRRRVAIEAAALPLPEKPRIFTIANQKGGVGKTTTTVNLAAALARAGANVLVIDLDPQGNASTALGVEHRADTISVYDVIINDEPMSQVVQKSPEFDGLYCVPATIHLAGAEIELVSLVAREQRLHTALDRFLGEAAEEFHYVFIDCPPSLGLLTINAFVAAREVLIPIQCEYYALEGLSQLLSNIKLIEKHLNPKLSVSTILLTMYDSRTNLANQVADEVREHFPKEVLNTLIPRSVRISEAPSYGQSVISYDPSSSGSLSYLEAASEIAHRGAPS